MLALKCLLQAHNEEYPFSYKGADPFALFSISYFSSFGISRAAAWSRLLFGHDVRNICQFVPALATFLL